MNIGLKNEYLSPHELVSDLLNSISSFLNNIVKEIHENKQISDSSHRNFKLLSIKLNSITRQVKASQDTIGSDDYTIIQDGKNDEVSLLFQIDDHFISGLTDLQDHLELGFNSLKA